MQDFFEQCRQILGDHLSIDPATIGMDTPFESINADSIDIVEMIMGIEDLYDVEFPEEELDDYKTMGSLVKVLYQYIQKQNG